MGNLDLLVGWLGKNAYQMMVKHDDESHGESNLFKNITNLTKVQE